MASFLGEVTYDGSSSQPEHPGLISQIAVYGLFGRYSYVIPLDSQPSYASKYHRLILLYGENGSGKTTLLSLVYHLLSPSHKLGHGTAIANTPFERVSVKFSGGITVEASRPSGSYQGDFEISVRDGEAVLATTSYVTGETEREALEIVDPRGDSDGPLLETLRALNLGVHYLTEDRTILSDELGETDPDLRLGMSEDDYLLRVASRHFGREDRRPRRMKQEQELVIALNRADRWLRQQAIQETSRGSANVNSIYLELIERIAQFGQKDSQKSDLSRLRQRIDDLGIQTREFAQYGLATELPSQRFLKALQEIPADRISLVDDIVEPHLDSIQAQLQALRGVHELISGFISSVNSFLSDKELRYTLREGFTILTSDHNPLKPAKLSSGERQLLLLLCNVLVARDSTRLFIIDEPEISLNVKWQRQFLDTLLEITAGTKMQFVVATHSIEMLSSHRESIARLVDQNE